MVFTRWLCTHSTRSMLVKIVHPGGHVELHDQPVLAAEIMLRNPRCCVAYPNVFRQPWAAIVAPNVMLMQGQKFYVVPTSTIRKLQRRSSLNQSPSPSKQTPSSLPSPSPSPSPLLHVHHGDEDQEVMMSSCWFCFTTQSASKQQPPPSTFLEHSDDDNTYMGKERSPTETRTTTEEIEKEEGCVSDENCLTGNELKDNMDDDRSTSTVGSSERKELVRKRRTKNLAWKGIRMPHKQKIYLQNWQPSLESIIEE